MFEAISPGRTRVAYHFDVRSNSWLLLILLREQRCLAKSKGVSIPITATEVARAAIARDGAAPLGEDRGVSAIRALPSRSRGAIAGTDLEAMGVFEAAGTERHGDPSALWATHRPARRHLPIAAWGAENRPHEGEVSRGGLCSS